MSAVLFIAIPLLIAFISILSKKFAPYLVLAVSFAIIVVLTLDLAPLENIVIGGFASPYGINLVFDDYSYMALLVVNVLFFVVAVINIANYKKLGSILLVALAGLNGLMLTGDLFNLFVFLEITGISAYLITTTNKKPLATFNYLVLGTVGSSLYLLGLIMLYNMFGTLNMVDLANEINMNVINFGWVALPFLLMFIGLGVESKLLPFNSWVKGILGSSNKLSGPMIAGVFAGASLFVFGRFLSTVFMMSDQLLLIVSVVVSVSILAGEAMAYSSTKAREILLFSSIAQAGIAVLVFMNGFVGYAFMFVALNAVSKVALFLVINHVTEKVGTDEMSSLKGLFVNNKVLGASFTVIILSLLGMPLFAGFIVKIGILESLFDSGSYFFPALILLSSVIEGVYFVKMLVKFWYKKGDAPTIKFELPLVYLVVVIAIGLVVFGLWMDPIREQIMLLGGNY